jgi:hypothetical protein
VQEEQKLLRSLQTAAKLIQTVATRAAPLPSEATAPPDQPVIPHSMFLNAPSYVQKIAFQINGCYLATAYDGCAVMIRRLIEMLIIDSFEKHNMGATILGRDNQYKMLNDLVTDMLAATWPTKLGRNVETGLKELKDIGNQSAHSRFYNAKRSYIDDQKINLRTVAERLLFLAGHKK